MAPEQVGSTKSDGSFLYTSSDLNLSYKDIPNIAFKYN